MTTAIILVNIERTKIKEAIDQIKAIKGITEVYTVAGEYDLVAVLRVKDNSCLARIVAEEMPHMDGITHTKTLVALNCHSTVDLEKVFKIA